MLARPGVERGRHVPSPHRMKEMSKEEMEKQARESAKCTYLTILHFTPLLFGVKALDARPLWVAEVLLSLLVPVVQTGFLILT